VGEQLSAPLRLVGRPIGRRVRGPRYHLRHRRVRSGCSRTAAPAIRVVREGESRRSYSLSPASGSHVPAHLSPTPFQRRGCGPSAILLGSCRAFTEPCRPLTFSRSLRGTPESDSESARCASPLVSTLAGRGTARVDLRAEGPCFGRPVKVYRAKARERLPSCSSVQAETCMP
jgi:hypothetical protein